MKAFLPVKRASFFLTIILSASLLYAQNWEKPKSVYSVGNDGKLTFAANDKGDRIPDFSHTGYMGGGVAIPNAPVKVLVAPKEGSDAQRIQAAIDHVAALPVQDNGLRGAVLLTKGTFKLDRTIFIKSSGIVLRGSGPETILLASSTRRDPLISISGTGDYDIQSRSDIDDDYVPVGANSFTAKGGFKPGDSVLITRACLPEWIGQIQMDYMGGDRHTYKWKQASREVTFDRVVSSVDGDRVTIDAPITTSLDKAIAPGSIGKYTWPGRIVQVGVENLRCDSIVDPTNAKDENHSWFAIHFENAADGWVRQVSCSHFASSTVYVASTCKRLTIEDCKSLSPISEIANERRRAFYSLGQQVLFQECYSENAIHDFSVGFLANLNAFVQCESKDSLDDSGPIDSWASGILYDNVRIDGNAISLMDRQFELNGAGWSAANSVIYQSSAALIRCQAPPGANNWAIGCWGTFQGRGHFQNGRDSVQPPSLYVAQLRDRAGADALKSVDFLPRDSSESSNPPESEVPRLVANSQKPLLQLSQWIDQAQTRRPIPTEAIDAKKVDEISSGVPATTPPMWKSMKITNGWLTTIDGQLITGDIGGVTWWAGGVRPLEVVEAAKGVSPTRFVPGRNGPGLTDDLQQVASRMVERGQAGIEHHYGLWYDIRDIDHERVRRMNGDVVPPFYELPFARSGQGVAWDGLSKYDLTKYNVWYWDRLRELAAHLTTNGGVLLQEHYFQHNILEAGAHWASNPWRSANNINNTGFPEPPPYAGDKRIFMADQFYDVTNTTRRALHKAFICQSVANFPEGENVLHLTSAEYTGPLEFTQLWVDTIADWEKETGRHAFVGLMAPKDVQDAILADAARAAAVDAIVIQGWWIQSDGTLFAQPGGINLAPRQYQRLKRPKNPGFEQTIQMIREYRSKFPDKPVIAMDDAHNGWAALMAGGSIPNLRGLDSKLLKSIVQMKPVDSPRGTWMLADKANAYLVYSTGGAITIDPEAGELNASAIDPRSGRSTDLGKVSAGKSVASPTGGAWVLWLHKN